jgi:hypothetical protein
MLAMARWVVRPAFYMGGINNKYGKCAYRHDWSLADLISSSLPIYISLFIYSYIGGLCVGFEGGREGGGFMSEESTL